MTREHLDHQAKTDLESLKTRLRTESEIQEQLQNGVNFADVVQELESAGRVRKAEISLLAYQWLYENYRFTCLSFNLNDDVPEWQSIYPMVRTWTGFDTVIVYHCLRTGVTVINPTNRLHWEKIEGLSPYELLVVFTKAKKADQSSLEEKYLLDFKAICCGEDIEDNAPHRSSFDEGKTYSRDRVQDPKMPAPVSFEAKVRVHKTVFAKDVGEFQAEIPSGGQQKDQRPQTRKDTKRQPVQKPSVDRKKLRTPQYSIQISNGLFHHGNVEAWQNIIESYQTKHPESKVQLYHEGNRINQIGSLFKWGKVKMGDSIFFSIDGYEIKNVAKLQKYLFEGASPRFSRFIKKNINLVLDLF